MICPDCQGKGSSVGIAHGTFNGRRGCREMSFRCSFCYDCAVKKVEALTANPEDPDVEYMVDGGWGIEGDGMAFCETCGCALDNSFTDYACEEELDHFEENGFTLTPSDCYSFDNILGAQPWEGGELSERIHALARKIVQQSESVNA